MLTRLRAKNFKAWRDTGDMRLAPLTVLFGTNSAGKSSIPQLLLMLKQTAESPDRQRPLQLGDDKKLVDLGTFEDVLYGHDLTARLEFELEFTLREDLLVRDPLSEKQFAGDRIAFATRVVADTQNQPAVSEIRYELRRGENTVLDVALRERKSGNRSSSMREFDLTSESYRLVRHQGRAWPLPPPVRFYGFPDETTAYWQNAAFTSDLVLALEQMLKSIYYVGPLREYPKRYYFWSGEVPDHVGARGERAVEAILASGERAYNWAPRQKTKSMQALVAERLKSMGLITDFEVKPVSGKVHEVLVTTAPKLPKVKLTDVGFGVSQVLPVIVECFYVPPGSIVIFEQPEIHLHPKVQADLADLLIDAVKAREGRALRNCQFIVESHSEHFLRRLQRRVAEEALPASDVALYFVTSRDGEAQLQVLDVDPYGNIKNWPEGFFGDEMGDLVARAEAQAKRMEKEGQT
jgi:predicted ATPase